MVNRVRNVKESVYLAMRGSIRHLQLLPGSSISETDMSIRYKVSRTPVREAFVRLAEEALIKVVPQKETTVSLIDLNRVQQEHFLRVSLEMAALEPFIAYRNDEHLFQMRKLIEMQEASFNSKDLIKFVKYDDEFHQIVFRGAGQPLSGNVVSSMSGHYFRIRLLSIWLNGVAYDVVNQHKQLLDALTKKDLAMAHNILKVHINKLNDEEKILTSRYSQYFASPEDTSIFDQTAIEPELNFPE